MLQQSYSTAHSTAFANEYSWLVVFTHTSASSSLIVHHTRLSTVSDRAFPVAAATLPRACNVTSRLHRPREFSAVVRRLYLFSRSFPDFL